MKLFLKGNRCDSPKCAIDRRNTQPGMHNQRRPKLTDYGIHLREKQKVKHYYGVLERQFRTYFAEASRSRGNTGNTLMSLLERRLDNIVHRLGFGNSRSQARQMICHGHITVNGRRVDIPSYLVKAGDVIRAKNRAKSLQLVHAAIAENERQVPDFLSRDDEALRNNSAVPEGRVVRLPESFDVSLPIQTQLIIELCSK
jgi:small subunit ribosomal protein S4